MTDDYPVRPLRGYQIAAGVASALIALTVAAYALGWVGELVCGVVAGVLSAVGILLIAATGSRLG